MKGALARIYALFRKELLQLLRDRPTLGMIVMLPIIQLLLFGYAINTDPKDLPTAIICQDHSPLTRRLVTAVQNTGYFRISHRISSDAQGEQLLQRGEVTFVLTVPQDFTRRVLRGEKPGILLQADATDPVAVGGAVAAFTGIMSNVCRSEFRGTLGELLPGDTPFTLNVHRAYNPEGFTRYNIVPGLIGIILIFTGVMMTALTLTREKERGTMENLLSMPVHPIEVMLGKVSPFVIIGIIQAAIVLALAHTLFHIPIYGSLSLLFLSMLLFIICNLSIGFLISSVAKNQTQALQMSMFVLLPSIMLTGFMFPFYGMPLWAQGIARFIPLTYFIRIVRSITLKGSSLSDVMPHLWPQLLLVLLIGAISIRSYRNTLG